MSYVDGDSITGFFFKDTVGLGPATVQEANIALAQDGSSSGPFGGIMGVGYTSFESTVTHQNLAPYPNIIQQMKQQGIINAMAYSVWLNDNGNPPAL